MRDIGVTPAARVAYPFCRGGFADRGKTSARTTNSQSLAPTSADVARPRVTSAEV
jgi:hypothetical protein